MSIHTHTLSYRTTSSVCCCGLCMYCVCHMLLDMAWKHYTCVYIYIYIYMYIYIYIHTHMYLSIDTSNPCLRTLFPRVRPGLGTNLA